MNDDEEYFSADESEEANVKAVGGKCNEKRRHLEDGAGGSGVQSRSIRKNVLGNLKDGQDFTADTNDMDEYVFDLDYCNDLDDDEIGSESSSKRSER